MPFKFIWKFPFTNCMLLICLIFYRKVMKRIFTLIIFRPCVRFWDDSIFSSIENGRWCVISATAIRWTTLAVESFICFDKCITFYLMKFNGIFLHFLFFFSLIGKHSIKIRNIFCYIANDFSFLKKIYFILYILYIIWTKMVNSYKYLFDYFHFSVQKSQYYFRKFFYN